MDIFPLQSTKAPNVRILTDFPPESTRVVKNLFFSLLNFPREFFFWAGWVGGGVSNQPEIHPASFRKIRSRTHPPGFFSQPLLDPLHPGGGVPFALRKALDATARSGIWGRLRPPTMHTQPQRSAPSPVMHPPTLASF